MASAVHGVRIHLDPNAVGALSALHATARPSTARHVVRPHPSFRQALDQRVAAADPGPAPASVPYIVRPGDTLSGIVKGQLAAQGLPSDGPSVQRGVTAVATANGLDNPNRIFPGQSLDLAILGAPGAHTAPVGRGGPAPLPRRIGLSEWLGLPGAASSKAPADTRAESPVLDGAAILSSGYGMRSDPFTGAPAFHAGVDLAASPGTPIRPMRDGVVVFSGWQRGYGRTVIVRHGDGLESVYAHNQKNQVRVGDAVTRETQLGEVGSTGRSTGPHLHFEVRKHGSPVNPLPYLASTQLAQASQAVS